MTSSEPRALLEESAWLHRLARRLVAEPASAEDAAQAALLAGLERAPEASSGTVPLRRWLAGVLRNLVRQDRRGAARRAARERARPLVLEDEATDELAARLELQQRLVARVRALDEPYRTTLALRFLDDLSPREVAARMGVPVKTVHTRIERALVRLREELDHEHGSRQAWAGLLLPLAASPTPTSAPAGAGPTLFAPLIAMGTLWKWTGAAVALALIGYVVVQEGAEPRTAAATPVAIPSETPELVQASTPAPESPPNRVREALSGGSAPASLPPASPDALAPSVQLVTGRVVDVERRGIPGLEVRFRPTSEVDLSAEALAREPRTKSGAGGAFELPLPDERGRLLASGAGYATLLSPGLSGEMPPELPLVVVAPAHTYGGIVVDVEGRPVPSAELEVRLTAARASELQPGALPGVVPLARVETDAEGLFLVEGVAFVEGVALEADVGGFERLHQELPPVDDLDLRIVLQSPAAAELALAGVVRFADGRPAQGAWVSAGGRPTRALEDGSFALALEPEEKPASVCAAFTGFQPARIELADVPRSERQRLVLELAAPALTIAGKVVDGAGLPITGAQVWTRGGESFGMVNRRFGEVDFYVPTDIEEVLASTGEKWRDGRESRTREGGRFRLSGLLERDYDVLVLHPLTQELAWLPSVPAGEQALTLVLAGAEPAREVRGRVLTLAGEPVAGALLRVYRQRSLPDGTQVFKQVNMDFHAETDERGDFRFEGLCIEGTHLVLNGEVIGAPEARALDQEPDLSNVLFRAPAQCHLRLILADPARADRLSLLDERDRPLSLSFMVGSVTMGAEVMVLTGGISSLIRTDESARTLVLTKGEQQERIPIRLKPGEVNELRL